MTKEQLKLIEDLIEASIKEHANDPVIHRKSSYPTKRIASNKIQQIHQRLLATCEDDK